MFEAGRLAAARNWISPSLIEVHQVSALDPTGDPVLVVAEARTVDAATARAIAAVAGAGREITLVTDDALPPAVQDWLPAALIHISGSAIPTAEGPQPSTNESPEPWPDLDPVSVSHQPADADPAHTWPATEWADNDDSTEAMSSQWVCHFESASAVESLQPALSGWAAAAWNQYVAQRQLAVMDQGNGDGVCAGAWALDDRLPAALWFQPTQSIRTGEEFLLVGSTIAVADDPAIPVVVPDSWWQQGFADQVVSWCEQPGSRAMINRVFSFGQPVSPLSPRSQPDECFPELPVGAVSRVLVVEDGQQMLVVPVAGEPRWVDNGPGSRSITFIYMLKAVPQYDQLEESWSHAIDSLVRIQRLLTHPDSDLDGRRDPDLATSLEAFLHGSEVTAAGTVAGRLRDVLDDPDLFRKAQVMSEVWVTTNGEPGWDDFRRIGEVGLKAAFRFTHATPDMLTGEQLGSISDIYRDLCVGLEVDATYPWTSFDEILHTVNARTRAGNPLQCRTCGQPAGGGDQFCGSCGQPL